MGKRIVVCCDGTWNHPDQPFPTNVVKMARAVAATASDGTPQLVYYDPGIGAGPGWVNRIIGGVSGRGLEQNVQDAYRFLMHNYEDGDEIFLFGFSRGAYTVRSAAGFIRNCGLLHKVHADRTGEAYRMYRSSGSPPWSDEATAFRKQYAREVEITCLGVWDTVGALGIPLAGLRLLTMRRHRFHDVELSRIVRRAYQALAIDERRGPFAPSVWESPDPPKEGQTIEQVWFAGCHSDVGGGYQDAGLADVSFLWMKERAEACGLTFTEDHIAATVHPDALGRLHDSRTGFYRLTWPKDRGLGTQHATEWVHHSAISRRNGAQPPYRASNLDAYLATPNHRILEQRASKGEDPEATRAA